MGCGSTANENAYKAATITCVTNHHGHYSVLRSRSNVLHTRGYTVACKLGVGRHCLDFVGFSTRTCGPHTAAARAVPDHQTKWESAAIDPIDRH